MATPSSGLSRLSAELYTALPTSVAPLLVSSEHSHAAPAVPSSERSKRGRDEEESAKSEDEDFLDQIIREKSIQLLKKKKFENSTFFNKFKSQLLNSSRVDSATLFLRFSSKSPEKILRDAAEKGATSLVKALIAQGVHLDNREESGKTAVELALSNGHFEIASLLIDAGAKDEKGQSPLIRAVQKKEYLLLPAFVLDREMLNDPDLSGCTPLLHAVRLEDLKALDILLEAKPHLELKDNNGYTPLHHAIVLGNEKIVAKLIASKAHVETPTLFKDTPLILAAGLSNSAIVLELLLAGAQIAPISEKQSSAFSATIKNHEKANFALLMEAVMADKSENSGLSLSSRSSSQFSFRAEEDLSQDPSLLLALEIGQNEIAIELSQKKIGIFYRDNHRIPLIEAAKAGCFEVVEVLVNAGVDLEDQDEKKYGACGYAQQLGHRKIADFLLEAGARNFEGETLITESILKRELASLEGSLKLCSGKNLIEKQNRRGETPLTLAIETENQEMVKLLIAHGANLESRNSSEETPLLKAFVKAAPTSLIVLLINSGANTSARLWSHGGVPTSKYNTPLQFAIARKDTLILHDLILKGANVHEKDDEGDAPLIQAIVNFKKSYKQEFLLQAAILNCLLSRGADIHVKRRDGSSVLEVSKQLRMNSIRTLLWKAGAKDSAGNTYLIERVVHRDVLAIKELLIEKINLNSQNNAGTSPLSIALERDFKEIISLLLEAGANPNLQDKLGRSCFLRAVYFGRTDCLSSLIAYKANVHMRTYDGSTALHLAAAKDNNEMLKALIGLGVDLDAKKNNGMTALQVAKEAENDVGVYMLLEAGARNEFGRTPLMRAVESGNMEMLRTLIAKGVDLEATLDDRRDDVNALSLSITYGNVEAFIELAKAGTKLYYKGGSIVAKFIGSLLTQEDPGNQKYHALIKFFLNPFGEHFIQLAETPQKLQERLNSRSEVEKLIVTLLEKIPFEQHHHLLKFPFLMIQIDFNFREIIFRKLSLESVERGFEVLQKEFPSSQFLYHCLKESHLKFSPRHFTHLIDDSIPSAPEVDLNLFLTLFRKINFSDPKLPGYAHPRMLKGDDGQPVEVEYFEGNLVKYVNRIKTREPFFGTPRPQDTEELADYYTRLTNIARHLVLKLQEPTMDPDNKTSLLLDLANAGDHCGARYMSESYDWYQRMMEKAEPQVLSVSQQILSALKNFRVSILSKIVLRQLEADGYTLIALGNLPHVRNQYLKLIGKDYALPGYAAVHSDRAFELNHLTKLVASRNFLSFYHPTAIIDHIQELILDPSPLSLSYQELIYWFETEMPENWKKEFYDDLRAQISKKIEEEEKLFSGLSLDEQLSLANQVIKTKIFPKYKLAAPEKLRCLETIEKLIDARSDLKSNQRENMKKQMSRDILAFENPDHLRKLRIREILNGYNISTENLEKWHEDFVRYRIQDYMREEVYASEETRGFKRSAIERMLITLNVFEVITYTHCTSK